MAGMVSVPFGHTRVNRIAPDAGPEHFKTYGASMPLATHWRRATCAEVDCDAYLNGWVSTFDLGTDLGQRQYDYCTHDRERRYSVQRVSMTVVKLLYGPGQRCFRSGDHRVPLERPARLYVAGGDWRGNPRRIPVRVHKRPEDWVEDFSEHQARVAAIKQRG